MQIRYIRRGSDFEPNKATKENRGSLRKSISDFIHRKQGEVIWNHLMKRPEKRKIMKLLECFFWSKIATWFSRLYRDPRHSLWTEEPRIAQPPSLCEAVRIENALGDFIIRTSKTVLAEECQLEPVPEATLSLKKRIRLAKKYAKKLADRYGEPVDFAIRANNSPKKSCIVSESPPESTAEYASMLIGGRDALRTVRRKHFDCSAWFGLKNPKKSNRRA